MQKRLSRAQQMERNRDAVIEAATGVFRERGFFAATLDHIAAEAGFSKGVVYSQFASKADLFLSILELRIERRAKENVELADRLSHTEGVEPLVELWYRTQRTERDWVMALIEFRVYAARHPDVNARYAAAHRRSLDGIVAALEVVYRKSASVPPLDLEHLARFVQAGGIGASLEQAAEPDSLPLPIVLELIGRALAIPVPTGDER